MNPQFSPGKVLLAQVRAGFVAQGSTFTQWCAINDVCRPNARQCLLGGWDGPKARELRAKIIDASTAPAMNAGQ